MLTLRTPISLNEQISTRSRQCADHRRQPSAPRQNGIGFWVPEERAAGSDYQHICQCGSAHRLVRRDCARVWSLQELRTRPSPVRTVCYQPPTTLSRIIQLVITITKNPGQQLLSQIFCTPDSGVRHTAYGKRLKKFRSSTGAFLGARPRIKKWSEF